MVGIMSAIDCGKIRVEVGSKKDVQWFFGYFDAPVGPARSN
jgi:hypothetical protein